MSTAKHTKHDHATTLWLHVHGNDHCTLAMTDANGKVIDDASYPLTALPPATAKHTPIHVLIPSHQVAFFTLDSTHIPRKKRSQALAYALEEQLSQAPEHVHAVLLDGPQPTQVMVADKAYLETLVATLNDKHYLVTQLLPESMALHACNHSHALYLDDDKAMLYTQDHSTITCMPSQLEHWLENMVPASQANQLHVYHTDPLCLQTVPETMRKHATVVDAHWLIEQQQLQSANFCQGELAPATTIQANQPAFWLLTAVCLASIIAYVLNPWWPLHQAYRQQQSQLKQFIAQHHYALDANAPQHHWQTKASQNNPIDPLLLINTINQQRKQNIRHIDYQQKNQAWSVTFASISSAERTAWQQALKAHHIQSQWQSHHGTWQLTWQHTS